MLEEQFYIRLMLNIVVGIMFAYALFKMAKHDNQEQTTQPHKILHIIGWIFVGISVICLCTCIFYLINVDFPDKVIGPFIGSNTIVRPSSSIFYWGYPTMIQNSVLTMAMSTFDSLGIGGYFLYFKSSKSKWWKKILKFFAVLFLYAFMASATNFHYFDTFEFVAPILFFILWLTIVNRKDSPNKLDNSEIKDEGVRMDRETLIDKGSVEKETIEEPRSLHSITDSESIAINETFQLPEHSIAAESDICANEMLFCRHCGERIERDSVFCKYCGKPLMNGEIKSVGSLFEKVTTIFKSIWETLINSLKRRMEISKVSVSDTHMVRKVFKIIGVSATGLLILGGIGTGIWYYFDEIRPKHRATQILNNEISSLIKLEGILLYNKCNDIIRSHNIPHCGKEWRDQTNLAELSDYAWVKVEYLAYQGNADAQFLMGLKYGGYDFLAKKWVLETYRDGTNQNPYLDYNKAAYWYLKAAEQNHSTAQNNLGQCYENGTGVEVNIKEAIKWYRLSAENGNSYGQLNLGDCYRDGHKITIGEHWEKDVDAGYYSWAYKLGYHQVPDYEVLIKQDIDSAKYYWQKSATQGNETAKERLQKIY